MHNAIRQQSQARPSIPGRPARRHLVNRGFSAFVEYKRQWIAAHPDATPAEFDRAMHRIARKCGV